MARLGRRHVQRSALLLCLVSLAVLSLAAVALANHPRPGGASPNAIKLVPRFVGCVPTGNADHGNPWFDDSCSPPVLESPVLTTSSVGQGAGSVSISVTSAPDVNVVVAINDVRCKVVGPNCTPSGKIDYTGQVFLRLPLRMSDHYNAPAGSTPIGPCLNGAGNPGSPPNYCVNATVVDAAWDIPLGCVATGLPTATPGATCTLNTTLNAVIPGVIKSLQRAIYDLGKVNVYDAGPDGTLTPGGGLPCPPWCGSGDETVTWTQGYFVP